MSASLRLADGTSIEYRSLRNHCVQVGTAAGRRWFVDMENACELRLDRELQLEQLTDPLQADECLAQSFTPKSGGEFEVHWYRATVCERGSFRRAREAGTI